MKKLGIFSLLFMLILTSCRKDVRVTDTIETTPDPTVESYVPPVNNVTAGVIGFIIDENKLPVSDAMVTLNNEVLTTDKYGHFFIENKTMNALGTLVEVKKDGYFEGSRRFFPIEGEQSRIKIQLLEKTFDESFDASSGGDVSISNGASVAFPPSSIKKADGTIYSGTVRVAAKWMDPSASATLDQMPGNLQGISKLVEQMALGTYGMIAVELEGDAGEPLNIADGSFAKITMPVPSDMQNGAPSEIPLWSYHKELGVWIEESSATLEGGNYVGEVSHFSFWNCDIPFEYVNLEMTLVDANEVPLNNYLVVLTVDNTNSNLIISGSGYSDQNGNVSGGIPANEILTMEIFNICGDVLSTQDIGPFAVDTDLGNVTVSGANINSTTITGNLLDCSGEPLTNGVVLVEFQGEAIYHYTDVSAFSITFSVCAGTTDISVTGVNLDDFEQSDAIAVTANISNDLGDVNVCGIQLQNYISLTIGGVNQIYIGATAVEQAGRTYIEAAGTNQYYVGFGFDGVAIGDYLNSAEIETFFDLALNWSYGPDEMIFTTFEVTQYDTLVVGTFTGDMINPDGTLVPVSGSFNVEL